MFFFKPPASSPHSSSFSSAIVHLRVGCTSPYLFTLLVLIFSFHILCSKDFMFTFSNQLFDAYNSYKSSSTMLDKMGHKVPFAAGEVEGGCDIFSGRWVWDDHRPLYEESECPYIPPQLTCQKHGRPDRDYQHWRWQPHGCSLPSFNATLILERLRNKRMMFVGDSLHRGQLVSLACLLHRVIPNHAKYAKITSDSMSLFVAKEYNATFEFYWAPFLLASSSDNAILHTIRNKQFIRKGSINEQGQHWKGFDILVFNTYMWWTKNPNVTMLEGSYDDVKKAKVVQVPLEEAYRMAIQGMVEWVEENMDPDNTRVFFTSMSPVHGWSREWGGNANGNCYNETSLIEDPNYWESDCRKNVRKMIGEMFRKSKFPITFLNITQLSRYRKDAHTSIYKKQWKPLTREQLKDPASYADCVHWCLPGLQDTWNELLFAKLFYP